MGGALPSCNKGLETRLWITRSRRLVHKCIGTKWSSSVFVQLDEAKNPTVIKKLSTLALAAASLPTLAAAQYYPPQPQQQQLPPPPGTVPLPYPGQPGYQASQQHYGTRAPVAEPWQAQPPPPTVSEPWQSPAPDRNSTGPALEPLDLPPAIEQGVEMIYIDEELIPRHVPQMPEYLAASLDNLGGAPLDLFVPVNPLYTQIRRAADQYRATWGQLPQVEVPSGPTLKQGMSGERVALLRQRLGLGSGDKFDPALAKKVADFQAVHGLTSDGIAGNGTLAALNRGVGYYLARIDVNLERAKRLPAPEDQPRYAIVDAGDARLSLWENGRKVNSMPIIVGAEATQTPMMAAYIRYVSANPYWNVPPELVKSLIAPRVRDQGVSYLTDREYQVLTDYSPDAQLIDPKTVDWAAVAQGRQEVRLRRLPSPANSMGMMKFMLPNYFGIYLHDSPTKDHFEKNELWISNGCVRLSDYKRFAKWLFGGYVPDGKNPKVEQDIDLPAPVPVYMTYLTVEPTSDGSMRFLPDHYGRDAGVIERRTELAMATVR